MNLIYPGLVLLGGAVALVGTICVRVKKTSLSDQYLGGIASAHFIAYGALMLFVHWMLKGFPL